MKLKIRKSATEEGLIESCQRRDPKAQEAVYRQYGQKMLGLCARYIKDHAEAEDIMITGFAKVFSKIDLYAGAGSFEGWIRRIMINESLAFIRKNKNLFMAVELEQAEREPDYNSLESALEAEDLMQMINSLPLGYRTVFNLYAIEGFSHKEIAEALDISENTSKSQLSRARAQLQKLLLESENRLKQKINDHEKSKA